MLMEQYIKSCVQCRIQASCTNRIFKYCSVHLKFDVDKEGPGQVLPPVVQFFPCH